MAGTREVPVSGVSGGGSRFGLFAVLAGSFEGLRQKRV